MADMEMIERTATPRREARRRWLARAGLCAALWPALLAGAARPAPPPELRAPEKPTAMPGFVLPTTAGTTLDSKSLKGQVVVIRFWASW